MVLFFFQADEARKKTALRSLDLSFLSSISIHPDLAAKKSLRTEEFTAWIQSLDLIESDVLARQLLLCLSYSPDYIDQQRLGKFLASLKSRYT